jgi:gluconolactonase
MIVIVATVLSVLVASTASAQEASLIAPDATVERIATGFGFLEGPAADADGSLYFTDIPNSRIHRWTPDGGVTTFVEQSGRANGLRFDLDGNLIICEMGTRRVTAVSPRGDTSVLAERFEGNRFNSPNDLWVDPGGGIYFTDPRYGATDDQEITGYHVYYISSDQSEIRQVAADLVRPNGIVGTPDGGRVYVADHGAGRTYVYTPAADGSLTDKRLFVAQGADGMTMDDLGNLYLTGRDITIYTTDGDPIGSIAVPETPANSTFGGPDGTTLFITARTSLYALEMVVSGQ